MSVQLINAPRDYSPPTSLKAPFSLSADSNTDLWRKPPATHAFSAPILYHSLPLSSLRRACITFRGSWRNLYDQGGLCLIIDPPRPETLSDAEATRHTKWVKTGIEFTHDAPHISTVSCDRSADWSLSPLQGDQVTIEMEREVKREAKTTTLWIYATEAGQRRRPVREITWVFEDAEKKEGVDGVEVWVGAFVAKPSGGSAEEATEQLKVSFWDMAIETWDGAMSI